LVIDDVVMVPVQMVNARQYAFEACRMCMRVSAGEPVDQYCARLLKATGVLLLPATLYDHDTSIEAGHFRLGLGRRNFAECMGKWEEFITSDH
jgi:aspartate/methionine/tyrosine aminotransferase